MKTNKKLQALIAITTIAAGASVTYFGEYQALQAEKQMIGAKISEADILASRSMLSLNDAATILRITAGLDSTKENIYSERIHPSLHGVSENEGMKTRQVSRSILEQYDKFVTIGLLLPNGDVYVVEPYSAQKNLTSNNLSFHDYYQGVINNRSQYLGGVIRSQEPGMNVASIATPIYDSDGKLKAIWVGALNLSVIEATLSEIQTLNTHYVLADQHGIPVAESDRQLALEMDSYRPLVAFDKAVAGEGGYFIEDVNGIKTLIAYHPVKVLSTTWVVMSFEPYEQALAPVNSIRSQTLSMGLITAGITVVFGIYMRNSFDSVQRLADQLQALNTQLFEKKKMSQAALEEMKQAEKAKEEFISMVSHELKTPLVPIKGYSEMLLQQPSLFGDLNDKQKKAIRTISRSCEKLETLVQDVLSVYKLHMEKMTFLKYETEISELVKRNISDLSPILADKQINVRARINTSGTVFCDPKRIDQVFSNLIENSADFVPSQGGRITVKAEQGEDSKVIFSVEDNGQGIPPDRVDKLFQKFYQIDTSSTRKHGGTGLGLVICKGIIEAHGGKIWVEESYKGGTSIKFSLPRTRIDHSAVGNT
ncbi:MAG TPA: sensor histidine kinase [Nitrososphaera sp.]|nr:sensor histidine kinase [Nitrososphaera sp.]